MSDDLEQIEPEEKSSGSVFRWKVIDEKQNEYNLRRPSLIFSSDGQYGKQI